MPRSRLFTLALAAGMALALVRPALPAPVAAADDEVGKIEESVRVLDEMMSQADKSIPLELMEKCAGVAIIPGVIRAAYIIGGRHGNGILLVKRAGSWSNPVFISLTGGSLGWQIGVQSADVILVFMTERSVENITRGKFTLGADAGLAVGPLGRNAQASTDVKLKAEIYSYSRSKGLYAGLSLQGANLRVDRKADERFYETSGVLPGTVFDGRVEHVPEVVNTIKRALEKYSR